MHAKDDLFCAFRGWDHRTEHALQPAGGVIHLRKRRAVWAAIFKPVMFRAVNLDQLTEIQASGSRLLNW